MLGCQRLFRFIAWRHYGQCCHQNAARFGKLHDEIAILEPHLEDGLFQLCSLGRPWKLVEVGLPVLLLPVHDDPVLKHWSRCLSTWLLILRRPSVATSGASSGASLSIPFLGFIIASLSVASGWLGCDDLAVLAIAIRRLSAAT